jgi:hypothetical protein
MTSPLNARDQELWEMKPVMSQFPVEFSTNARWTEFDGKCTCCNQEIERALLRGLVSRPIPSVAVVEAIGLCKACKRATRFNYRLHKDMHLSGKTDDGWEVWPKAIPSFKTRVLYVLKKLLAVR